MAATRQVLAEAAASLSQRDPILRDLLDQHGKPPPRPHIPASLRFAALARSILYQQLAANAAGAIHARFVSALGGVITPDRLLALSPDILASCGLSGAKSRAIRDLAEKVSSGQVSLDRIGRLSDKAVIEPWWRAREIGRGPLKCFCWGHWADSTSGRSGITEYGPAMP